MYEEIIDAHLEGFAGPKKWRKVFGTYTLEFTSIAASASGSKNRQIQADAAGGFVVDTIMADVRVNTAVGGYSQGKVTAARRPYASADDTDHLPLLSNVFAKITVNNIVWNYDRIPLTHLSGEGDNPAFLPTRPRVGANNTIQVEIDNETEVAVIPVISFIGFKLYPVG